MQQPASRARRIVRLLTHFFLGQGALQGLNIVTGLYLVRALSVDSYAQYGLTASIQQTMSLLTDLGFASTIIPLVGGRAQDRALVGRYVRAAKHLRDRVFLVLLPVTSVVFLAIMHRHGWPWSTQLPLLASVLVSIYAVGKTSYYAAPLYLHRQLKECYVPQVSTGLARLLTVAALRIVGALNGWSAAAVGAVAALANGQALQRAGRRCIEWPRHDDPATDREVLRYLLPAVPIMIFSALQVQSSVFLIGIFGQSAGLAQVAALGRLSQLFSILTVFNAVVVEPSLARLAHKDVAARYLLLAGLASAACVPFVLAAFFKPGAVLWLLGSKYEGLQPVIGWAMLAGALNYLQVLLWIMNRSRQWVFWRGTVLEIVLTLASQIAFLAMRGVHTTADAVFFSLVSCAGPLATHLYIAVYGFARGNTQLPR